MAQTSSNPMRRLLQRDPATTPRPQPTAAPAAPSESRSGSGDRESRPTTNRRNARRSTSNSESADSTNPSTTRDRESTRESSNRRNAKATPDPNALLVRSANEATTVVKRFLQYSNDGRYSQARALLTTEVQKYFDSEFSAVHGDLMAILDNLTKDGQLSLIRYPLANVRGEGITVVADMQYRDGTSREQRFRVIQVGRDYRIALDVSQFSNKPVVGAAGATPAPAPAPRQSDRSASERTPAVSAASEDILTGSGVVTRPEGPGPTSTPRPVKSPAPPTDPAATESTMGTRNEDNSTTTVGEVLQDKPWPASTAVPEQR